jgi:hypothetical protein
MELKNLTSCKLLILLAPLARLERAAHGLGIRCSIHLSYRGIEIKFRTLFPFRQG